MSFRCCGRHMEWLLAVITLASLACLSHSYPIAGGTNPVVHSLATFATTNSFVFAPANNLGRLNYRFAKSPLSPLQAYTKYIGLSHPQTFVPSTGPIFTSTGGTGLNQIVSLEKNVATGEIKLSSADLSTYLTPPQPDSTFSTFLKSDEYIDNNLAKSNDLDGEKFQIPLTASGNDVSDPSFSSPDGESSVDTAQMVPDSRQSTVPEELDNSKFIPFDASINEEPFPQNRQDSSFEQPLPFFSSVAQNQSPQPHTPPPQYSNTGNFGLTGPSTLQQGFPAINRFAVQRNVVPQSAIQPASPPAPQPQGHSQLPPSNNGFPVSYAPNPPQPHFPPPRPYNTGAGGGLPQEPENGFNPFHLRENYPEPPYESEFANDRDEFIEQRHISPSRNNANSQPPAPLDFAQSTLRNIRTEELLDVVKRKPVPSDCVYNTISYGANGEDCVSKKK